MEDTLIREQMIRALAFAPGRSRTRVLHSLERMLDNPSISDLDRAAITEMIATIRAAPADPWSSREAYLTFVHGPAFSQDNIPDLTSSYVSWTTQVAAAGGSIIDKAKRIKAAVRRYRSVMLYSLAKALGVTAAITCLVTICPSLLVKLHSGNMTAAEALAQVLSVCGAPAWRALCQGGVYAVRALMFHVLGKGVMGSLIGNIAVEAVLHLYRVLNGENLSDTIIDKLGGMKAVCTAVIWIFKAGVMVAGMVAVVQYFGVGPYVKQCLSKLGEFVKKVIAFVVKKLGPASTLVGGAILLGSQAGNATFLVGYFGATAGTGTPIAALSGAAARRAALAWLGGGPVAAGGGGMAAGSAYLAIFSILGWGLAFAGAALTAYQVYDWLTTPNDASDIAVDMFDQRPEEDDAKDAALEVSLVDKLVLWFLIGFVASLLVELVMKYPARAGIGLLVFVNLFSTWTGLIVFALCLSALVLFVLYAV